MITVECRPGPCINTAIWCCCKTFSQWQHSFQWKLCSHWLKVLRQRHVHCRNSNTGPRISTHERYPVSMMTSSNGNIFRVTGHCAGIHRSPVNSPYKGQWRGALVFSLICTRINGWVNNREASDLRRHRAHYDVIVRSRPGCMLWLHWRKLTRVINEP